MGGGFGLLCGCALAPSVFEHPPIFQIEGIIDDAPESSEPNDASESDEDVYYVVLSWYLFIANGLTEAPWDIADQTEVVVSEGREFVIALNHQPPRGCILARRSGSHPAVAG